MSKHHSVFQSLLLQGSAGRPITGRKILITSFLSLGFLFFLSPFRVQAQEKMEVKELYFFIDIVSQKGDSVYAVITNAENVNIEDGAAVKAWRSYKQDQTGKTLREYELAGTGTFSISGNKKTCRIKLLNERGSFENGDMISVRVSIPFLSYRSIFSQLAFHNIHFGDFYKKPLYNLVNLIYRDSRQMEDSIFSKILADFKAVYDYALKKTDLPDTMLKPMRDGRLKGKIPLDVLGHPSRHDIESFFLYASVFPAKYMQAQVFRASESFVGWLTSNAPYSYPEVKKALFPVRNDKTLFTSRLPLYKNSILMENAVIACDAEVSDLLRELKFKEAEELAVFAVSLAYAVKDTINLPTAHLILAQVYLDKEKYTQCIAECDKAGKVSKLSGNRNVEIRALIKKAFCLFKISKIAESEELFNTARSRLLEYRPFISDSFFLNNRREIFEFQYRVSNASGNYNKAFQYIDSLITYNKLINSNESILQNAGYYKLMGEVYNKQGQPDSARLVLEKARDIYHRNSNLVDEAFTENEIANSYFDLGDYRKSIEYATLASKKYLSYQSYNDAGLSYSITGQSYWGLGLYDSAVMAHRQAIAYQKTGANPNGMAWSWTKIGELYRLAGQKDSALNAFNIAGSLYSSSKDDMGLADAYNQKGIVYLNDENYKMAVDLFEKAKSINSKTDIDRLYNLGQAWWNIDTTEARKYFEDARKKSIAAGNISSRFSSDLSLARLAYSSNNRIAGNRYYDECIQISSQTKTPDDSAYCLMLKAFKLETETLLDSALLYYEKAASIFSNSNKSQVVNCLNSIAGVLISMGEFSKADSTYRKAIDFARSISDQLALGSTLNNTVFLYGRTGDFEKGFFNSDTAFSIFKNSGNNVRLAGAYITKGTLLGSLGEFDKAIRANLTADSIYKNERISQDRPVIYNNIGWIYRNQGDYANALKNFDLALKLLPKGVMNEMWLLVQDNRAECLHYLKRSKEAENLLLQILPRASELKLNRIASGMGITLGTIYFDQDKMPAAKEKFSGSFDLARASGEKDKTVEALTWLGRIHAKTGNTAEAEKNFRQAIRVIEEMKATKGWESYYELGLLYFTDNRYDSAAALFNKAVDLLEKNMENLFGGEEAKKIFNNDPRKADLYNKITFSFYKLGNVTEAWKYANLYMQAGLREFAGAVNLNSPDKEKNEVLQKIYAMQQEVKMKKATAEKQEGEARQQTLKIVEILEADYHNFINKMAAKYKDLDKYFLGAQARQYKNYIQDIPDDVAVLLYIQNGKTLLIINLIKGRLAVDTIPADPEKLVKSFVESLASGPLMRRDATMEDMIRTTKQQAESLYNMLIGPLDDSVKSMKRYCIIPTGIYSNLPFQCLGHHTTPTDFKYLVEERSIVYASDVSWLISQKQPENEKNNFGSFAAFGVPDDKLNFNIEEVKTIGKILGADSTIYTSNATKNRASQNLMQKKIIHFATHGELVYTDDFSKSYLKLLPDKDNDGRLTMNEINQLHITNCYMVILSACQTAVSKALVAGWNISPTNSFLMNKVRSVVASLWKVADEPSGLLMKYFYNNLKSMETIDKAEALRQAQIQLSKDPRFVHPNYWGAFALYGDWR